MSAMAVNATTASDDTCSPTISASHFQAAWSVVQFFAINIIAHCLTMRGFPGQSFGTIAGRAIIMIIGPVFAGMESLARLFAFFAMIRRAYVPGSDDAPRWSIRRFWRLRNVFKLEPVLALEKACNAGAVAIHVPYGYQRHAVKLGWDHTNRKSTKCLTISGHIVPERSDLFTVPYMAKVNDYAEERAIIPQTSLTQTAVAFYQVLYSSVELFGSNWESIRQRGLSSPYILVIPYAFMSSINLLVNVIIPSYSYVTVLDPCHSPEVEQAAKPPSSKGERMLNSGEKAFISWVERTYGLCELHNCPHDSRYIRWGQLTSAFICLPLIIAILLSITRCHIQETGTAVCFLAWIFVGNFFTAILLATDFSTMMENTVFLGAIFGGLGTTLLGAYIAGKELYSVFLSCP